MFCMLMVLNLRVLLMKILYVRYVVLINVIWMIMMNIFVFIVIYGCIKIFGIVMKYIILKKDFQNQSCYGN